MNKRMLEAKMKLHGITGRDLAKEIDIASNTFSLKLNEKNGAEFNQSEILKMKNILNLSNDEIIDIFFN